MKSRGLGDTVKKVLEKVGFQSCESCEKRQRWLNKHFPYLDLNPIKGVLTDRQRELWQAFKQQPKTTLIDEDMDFILHIYCELFHTNLDPCRTCGGSGWKALIDRIDNVYKNDGNK
jgi:hypothetical protein